MYGYKEFYVHGTTGNDCIATLQSVFDDDADVTLYGGDGDDTLVARDDTTIDGGNGFDLCRGTQDAIILESACEKVETVDKKHPND